MIDAQRLNTDYAPLLRWLIFTTVWCFGLVLVWRFGLIRLMINSDKTYISVVICLFYLLATAYCLHRVIVVSSELNRAHRVQRQVMAVGGRLRFIGEHVLAADGAELLPGRMTNHIRNLIIKAGIHGDRRLDQTLLLRGLANSLRAPNQFGSFASDTMLKLGLLGTIIGFILMLAPVSAMDAMDKASMKNSISLMSDGMAIAMYTTLTGLVGSILVRIQDRSWKALRDNCSP